MNNLQHNYIKVFIFNGFRYQKEKDYLHPSHVLFTGMQKGVVWLDDNKQVHTKETIEKACSILTACMQIEMPYIITGVYQVYPFILTLKRSAIIICAQEPYKTITYENLEYFDLNFYMQLTLNLIDQFGIEQLVTGASLQELEQCPEEF